MVSKLILIGSLLLQNWDVLVAAVIAVFGTLALAFGALVSFFLIIPGEQPERFFEACGKFCQKIADALAPFSKKPKGE
jgi:hypothetical protein